ncbi:toxin glutamine deamidase domain-containing protein [Frankia sp. AgKG'84/4]|uniref:toxin glutamine deamidase domain-containing protein n=1 Tax=Frankia sp. AgKG'84/4 TaxID=573490 RepID=UPI00201015DF|nr:toxin glutamine deamidase domain-containing protein [Frankia sp. AgKG'84/4]MCL9795255.1 toxin glutamine deamidase domain-containing protein [Frankia sp. AgKG'84/4]
MDALDRAALRFRDSSPDDDGDNGPAAEGRDSSGRRDDAPRDGGGLGFAEGEQRAAPSDRFNALTRWARRRDEPPVPAERQPPGDENRPETPLDRKLALLDEAAARSTEPVERESTDSPRTMTQADFWRRHPDEYIPPGREARRPDAAEPFRNPRDWVADINPDRRTPGRDNNCGECTRATELSWRGFPAVSAAYGIPNSPGETDDRMEEWSRTNLEPRSFDQVAARLTDDGHGASALVAVSWRGQGGGHWFNMVNYNGEILAVDSQRGRVEEWPPSRRGIGFDESMITESLAVTFDPDGRIT